MKRIILSVAFLLCLAAVVWMLAGSGAYGNRLDTKAIDRLDDDFFMTAELERPEEYEELLEMDSRARGLYVDGMFFYGVVKEDGTLYRYSEETEDVVRLFQIGDRSCGFFVEDGQLYFMSGRKDQLAVKWDKLWGKGDRDTRLTDVRRWKFDFENGKLEEIEKKAYDEAFQNWRS